MPLRGAHSWSDLCSPMHWINTWDKNPLIAGITFLVTSLLSRSCGNPTFYWWLNQKRMGQEFNHNSLLGWESKKLLATMTSLNFSNCILIYNDFRLQFILKVKLDCNNSFLSKSCQIKASITELQWKLLSSLLDRN